MPPDENASDRLCRDVQFHEGVREMFRHNRSSADFFRRKLNIGYNKASQWSKQLEDMGFVPKFYPADGSARKILVTWTEWLLWLDAHSVDYDPKAETYTAPWAPISPEIPRTPEFTHGEMYMARHGKEIAQAKEITELTAALSKSITEAGEMRAQRDALREVVAIYSGHYSQYGRCVCGFTESIAKSLEAAGS